MYYLLDKENRPFPTTVEQVIANLDRMKNVKKDVINDEIEIHTVFTFFNLLKNDDRLYLFSTKVHKDGKQIRNEIYQTHEEAVKGHNKLLNEFNERV